ncbi:exodeoxyribonuclease VII large subunit [Rothia sp. ZJ932]|uniref:exodeoxyribonuclease VII large subunit n=1 Tax=Rothia sp. ZJ932 TaxID=2810516 RepID=UPI0019674CD0|nr:exodeoxyribonuclease VII large subunit [Rothia sp. ZJ932]QRZ62152.1 exodeoxyribonuclease VII large subunit [Rothia sp. ZJ932]
MTSSFEPSPYQVQVPNAHRQLAPTAGSTSPENPWPLKLLSTKLHEHVAKASPTWVEGQIIELNKRARVTYLTLRDIDEEISVSVTLFDQETAKIQGTLERGQRVIIQLKPDYWVKTGRLSMHGRNLRTVGTGSMLERIEKLKQSLAAEGLFDQRHKKPLPLLPHRIGLITGCDSDAMKDVIRNASLRWPAVAFEVREVAVQGVHALREVTQALSELDAHPEVDVIVIARGGGSLEDLLPFSEEAMVRALFVARTPVVSAIGHEADSPLIDHVADVRASTPTDAGKRVVPDVAEEKARITQARAFVERSVQNFIGNERASIAQVKSRPVLLAPRTSLLACEEDLERLRSRALTAARSSVVRHHENIRQLRARVTALSPQRTLERGYAVVQTVSGELVRDARNLPEGTEVMVRAAQGLAKATVTETFESNI